MATTTVKPKGTIKTVNIHAGHNAPGKVACGAVGLLDESKAARDIVKYAKKKLKAGGVKVYDCTVDDATSQSDNLAKIVAKCNAHSVDLNVSVHLNSGANDKKGNGQTTGSEVLICSHSPLKDDVARRILNRLNKKCGYKNRGVKIRTDLYVLNKTKAPAVLVEACFVDDKDDVEIYGPKRIGYAIAKAIMNVKI